MENMLTPHFPALMVVLPLLAAPLCVLVRHSLLAWWITLLVNSALVVMAVSLLFQVMNGEVIRYALGGWAAPTGIEYYIDTLNGVLLLLIAIISVCTVFYSRTAIKQEIAEPQRYLFYTGWLLCLTGLLGIVITGDAFNVFVFLEISSLSMYLLIALGKERRHALLAAFRYLILGSIGASFILLGIGFLYAATGTLNMYDLAGRLPAVADSRTVVVGFSFICVGLFIKAAIFPVYSWLPGAYQYAPSAVSAFLAGTATKVSLYVFLRFLFHVFGEDFTFADRLPGYILLPLSVIGFVVMSIVAVFQSDIRRLLAYSSIAQIGYIMAAVSMATQAGITAGIIHIINHAFIKTALFLAAGCMVYRLGSARIADMSGLIGAMPWTIAAFIVAGLSLIGLPLTAGFISKWYLIVAAIDSGWWLIAIMVLLSSLTAVIYIGKIIETVCFQSPGNPVPGSNPEKSRSGNAPNNRPVIKEAPLSMLIPLWLLVAISLAIGINGSFVVDTAGMAASQLLEGMR